MMSPLKWIFASILVIALVLGIAYASSIQNINTNTVTDIEVLADTISAGTIRSEMNENGKVNEQFFDKDELIANLTAKIVSVQKNHPYDIHFDYVFFDKNGQVTNVDKEIRSVQFRIQYVNEKGEVKATSERHLAINQLGE